MQCSMMQTDCRAVRKEGGAYMCTALLDTDFGNRACPFYKPEYLYNYELTQIAKSAAGYTPIRLEAGSEYD